MTLDCLHNVAAEFAIPMGLRDGHRSAEMSATAFPYVWLIARQKNHDFTKANNPTTQEVQAPYPLLDPDTLTVDQLTAFAKRTRKIGMWNSVMILGKPKVPHWLLNILYRNTDIINIFQENLHHFCREVRQLEDIHKNICRIFLMYNPNYRENIIG